jgi:hypothetical protein
MRTESSVPCDIVCCNAQVQLQAVDSICGNSLALECAFQALNRNAWSAWQLQRVRQRGATNHPSAPHPRPS